MKRGLNKENSLPDPEFGGESSESARAIHYVVQKDTLMTYVSARFAQADPGIVSGSTIERKKMSTKTIYKRIALVAVAALGAGVLSVAPANAATYVNVFTTDPAQVGAFVAADGNTSVQLSGANNFVEVTVNDSGTDGVLTVSGSTLSTSATTGVSVSTDKLQAFQTAASVVYSVPTKTAGTITLKWYRTANGATSADVTGLLTITVNDAANYLVSAAKSTSIIDNATGGYTNATSDDTIAAVGFGVASAKVAQINVDLKNGLGTALGTGVTVAATISGSGLISGASAAARVATRGSVTSTTTFDVFSDGTAGTGTITITVGTTVIATETVTFSGAPTKVVAAQNLQVTNGTAKLGAASFAASGASNGAVTLTVTDANGNPVTNVDGSTYGVVVTSSDKTIISTATDSPVGNGKGAYALTATAASSTVGKSATLTYAIVNVATEAVLATSAPVTFAVGGTTIASVALAFDKATYAPGEKATITLTAKDKDGFAIADGARPIWAAANVKFAGLLSSSSLTTAPFSLDETATGTTLLGGKATATIFMPLTSGPVTVSAATIPGVAGVAGSTITATATVGSSSDLSAITTLINSLIAKINALNKLVAKIQKKVRA
jgi:trimeric autotransporter adhesin